MSPRAVRAAPGVLDAIRREALAARPRECCGLLVGRRRGEEVALAAAHPSPNLAPEPTRRFEVDPGLRLRLQRESRGRGEEVVGLYHSHPDGDARPSARDRAGILEPGLVWVIAAPGAAPGPDLAAWLADGDGFRELPLLGPA